MLVNLTSLCDCHGQAIIYNNVNPKFDKQRWVIHMLEPGKILPSVTNPLVALEKMTTKHDMQQILAECCAQSIAAISFCQCCLDGEMLPYIKLCSKLKKIQHVFFFFSFSKHTFRIIYHLFIQLSFVQQYTHLLYLFIDVSFLPKDWLCATSQPSLILACHSCHAPYSSYPDAQGTLWCGGAA